MADVTAKLAEALRWIADYPHTHDSHLIAMRNGAREALAAYEQAQAATKFDAEVHSADANLIGKHNALWVNYMALKDEVEQLRERLAATPAPAPNADTQDAARWRTFIGLPHAIRAEWAANLSLAPMLTSWVDSAAKEQRDA